MDEICASPEQFDVDDCETKLEYHKGFYSSINADDTYGCVRTQWSDCCTTLGTLVVVFKNIGNSSNSDTIRLKISSTDNVTSVYVIVGITVGVIVLVIIITVVVICVCCRRRRNKTGTVDRAPQPAVVTTTTAGYPMQTRAEFQPEQSVYQLPAPQTGNQQPPPQMGYQQPQSQMGYPTPGWYQPAQQTGYPPVPQQEYAGNHTGADPNPEVKASAGYPMQTQAEYQPVQPVYQLPAPQTGNQQPPPQMGYQQPQSQMGYPPPGGYQPAQQSGYPPAPQQGYTGNHTGADPILEVKALAGYPMRTQAEYQPVQPVYQLPASQTGNQQPPSQMGCQQPQSQMGYPSPGGYQPAQQSGYPSAPQQGDTVHHTGADANPEVKALDPPMQPPPYPGN